MNNRDFSCNMTFIFVALQVFSVGSTTSAEPTQSRYQSTWDQDGRNPVLEVFIPNLASSETTWSNAWVDGVLVSEATNQVLWSQWYPSERALPGDTVMLQLSLPILPTTNQTIEIQAASGEKVRIVASPNVTPAAHITGVSFDSKIDTAYVSYSIEDRGPRVEGEDSVVSAPSKVFVNGKGFSESVKEIQPPNKKRPGIISVKLPKPLAQGWPVHIKLMFEKKHNPSAPPLPQGGAETNNRSTRASSEKPLSPTRERSGEGESTASNAVAEYPRSHERGYEIAQDIVRAHWGVCVDSWGVKEDNVELRKQLNLDLRPHLRHIPDYPDPTCQDRDAKKPGMSAPFILATRQNWYYANDNRLSYLYLCSTSKGHFGYGVYGRLADATFVNPFRLGSSQTRKIIEEEEEFCQWTAKATGARPWGWIPEAFALGKRMLEPEELRLGAYAALGLGAKGIMYYVYDDGIGFHKAPRLEAEAVKLNKDIKTLEPWLGSALPLSSETQGGAGNWVRVSTLWSGEKNALVVFVRNMDYKTDREPNDWCNKPRFKFTPKRGIQVRVRKPDHFTPKDASDALANQSIPMKIEKEDIILTVGDFDLGKVVVINSGTSTAQN